MNDQIKLNDRARVRLARQRRVSEAMVFVVIVTAGIVLVLMGVAWWLVQ